MNLVQDPLLLIHVNLFRAGLLISLIIAGWGFVTYFRKGTASGGLRSALVGRGLPCLVVRLAVGARGAALRPLVLWPVPVTPAFRRVRWPSARLPITTATAW